MVVVLQRRFRRLLHALLHQRGLRGGHGTEPERDCLVRRIALGHAERHAHVVALANSARYASIIPDGDDHAVVRSFACHAFCVTLSCRQLQLSTGAANSRKVGGYVCVVW